MSKDLIKLQAPEGTSGVSVGEVNYKVVDGVVEVPSEAVVHLVDHGFTTAKVDTAKTQAAKTGGKR